MGNRPRYKLNGVAAFVVTHALFYAAAYPLGLFSPTIVYDHFGAILVTLKPVRAPVLRVPVREGHVFPVDDRREPLRQPRVRLLLGRRAPPAPPRRQPQAAHQLPLRDDGLERHPPLVRRQADAAPRAPLERDAGRVALQLVYIFKFFVWEGGYFRSLDIMHDRFGFYICWGVLAWVPCVYTLVGLYLVDHPIDLPGPLAAAIFVVGVAAIWDQLRGRRPAPARARHRRRHQVGGKPPELIRARYTTGDGRRTRASCSPRAGGACPATSTTCRRSSLSLLDAAGAVHPRRSRTSTSSS